MSQNQLFIILIVVVSLIFYSLTLKGVPGNPQDWMIKDNLDAPTKPLELSPERGRFIMMLALAQNHTFSLSKQLADAAYPDVGYYNGRFFVYFAPGISLIALPMFLLGEIFNASQLFSFGTITLFSIANLILLYILSQKILKIPPWAGLAAVFTYAFASTSWAYALTLYQHQVTTFFILMSFFSIWKFRQQKKWNWMWGVIVWINYGLSILIDYPNGILLLPVMVYFLISSLSLAQESDGLNLNIKPAILITSIIFFLITVAHGYYNYTNFGGWTRLSGGLIGYKFLRDEGIINEADLINKVNQIQLQKNPGTLFKEEYVPNGLYTLLIAPDKGLFLFCPVFICAIIGAYLRLRNRVLIEDKILIATALINLALYASFGDPWGGWAFGPRYLIPGMAILSLYFGYFLVRVHKYILLRITAFILLIFSIGVNLLGAITTNAVPPKSEAVPLNAPYGFPFNWMFLQQGKISSFLYNYLLNHWLSPFQFYILLLTLLLLLAAIIVFVLPRTRPIDN